MTFDSLPLLRYWSLPPVAMVAIDVSAILYWRGWRRLNRAGVAFVPAWRAAAFLSGLFTVWIALASPIDALNGLVLTAHMAQHLLLMMVAPPLMLLGAPLIPMARGLPGASTRRMAGRFLNWPAAQRIGRAVTHPLTGALSMSVVLFGWHAPAMYELALRSERWHDTEHATFFLASLLFWWPVVLPWPSRAQWPRWAMVPYLLLADLQNTALSAILAFSDRVLYPSYSDAPRFFSLSPLEDQIAAGAFMWVAGSLAFVLPAIVLAVRCLSTSADRRALSAA